jgi:hypothetical protein
MFDPRDKTFLTLSQISGLLSAASFLNSRKPQAWTPTKTPPRSLRGGEMITIAK